MNKQFRVQILNINIIHFKCNLLVTMLLFLLLLLKNGQ